MRKIIILKAFKRKFKISFSYFISFFILEVVEFNLIDFSQNLTILKFNSFQF